MDSNPNSITYSQRQELEVGIMGMLKDTNRCIHKWGDSYKVKDSTVPFGWRRQVISYSDLKGLLNNWFTRWLKPKLGPIVTKRLLRTMSPISISTDATTRFITKIELAYCGDYELSSVTSYHKQISDILSTIDYKKCFYDEVTDPKYYTPGHDYTTFSPLFNLDLTKIRDIKF